MSGSEMERTRVVALTLAMTALGSLAVVLRVIARAILIRNFGLDDLTICIGWIFAIGFAAEVLTAVWSLGIGYSVTTVRPDQIVGILKNSVAIEITYYGCVSFIKMSILFFYLRIAATYFLIIACRATIGVLAVFFTVCVIVVLTQCMPLELAWDITGTVAGHCINTTAFFYSTSSIHILLDLWIIALPIKSLLRIQRVPREKIALFIIFGVGIFSMVSSCVRLYSIRIFTLSTDPVRDAIPVNLWSILEVNVGIICASVPALKPLFTGAQRARTTEGSGSYPYGSKKSGGGLSSAGARSASGILDTKSASNLSSKSKGSRETYNMKSFSTTVRGIGGGGDNKSGTLGRDDDSTDNILPPSEDAVYQGDFAQHHPGSKV